MSGLCRCSPTFARARTSRGASEALLKRIVRLDPNHLPATQALALLSFGKGALAEAEIHARNAVRIAPLDPQSHNLMGMIMTEAHRPQVGEHHYRRAQGTARRTRARSCSPTSPGTSRTRAASRSRAPYTKSRPRSIPTSSRPCSAGRRWRRPTAISPAPASCSTRPRNSRRTRRASCSSARCSTAASRTTTRRSARWTGSSADAAARGLGPVEASEKGRPARQDRAAQRGFRRLRRGQARPCARSRAWPIGRKKPRRWRGRLKAFFVARRLKILPRAGVQKRRRPADLHRRLSPLRHHDGRADAFRASDDRGG